MIENQKVIIICYSNPKTFPNKNYINPKEFLSWAKQDVKGGHERGYGNALGNIKKAIHCRIDEVINSTHITYGKGWDWWNLKTEDKLRILKEIGIGYTQIANIITNIRNVYEHQYKLPPKEQIEAYVEATELWIEKSYQQYSDYRIGLVDLPVKKIKCNDDGEVNELIILGYIDVTYFWDNKKSIVKTSDDHSLNTITLKELTWKEILNIEKKHIRKLVKSGEYYHLSQSKLTNVFKKYNKMRRNGGFFPPSCYIKITYK